MADDRFFYPPKPRSVDEIAKQFDLEIAGACRRDLSIEDIAPLQVATAAQLSFLTNKKYKSVLQDSQAGACILVKEQASWAPKDMTLLIANDAHVAYAKVAQLFYPEPSWTRSYHADSASIHPSAKVGSKCIIDHNVYIGKHVEIDDNTWIKPNAVIGHGVKIGQNSVIGSNVTITHSDIGRGARILAGVRIGQEGFGFATDKTIGQHIPIPQLGRVLIGDNVWIGANTTIDRGAGPDTIIGSGVMIDNLVQIAHNVKIGHGCVLASQVGIAGSAEIGDYVVLAGQVGVAGHLKIGTGAQIAGQSGVVYDIEPGAKVMGTPPVPLRQFYRQAAIVSKLAKKEKTS